VPYHEDDISAKEKTKSQGSWIQKQNEYSGRKKGFGFQKIKGKKKIISLDRRNVVFSVLAIK
jgi:hypothetical protein